MFKFNLDWETSERAGAGGMFQVISIKDDDDNDVTDQYNIDAGMHYSSLREVIIEMGLDPDKVDYEEEE
ncbi:hypothetical protein J4772_06275 [Cohnella sp. LGH]|jgi:type I restriction enzyme S subunit|uniref:hypothetical protein n=1 Tax=Cohnella sp. LGH TaxID=1619153 RepID=UPI001AD9F141|nr:hypothetical protein [Cohnella sp. LGH]QTH44008.1 hypothetical protein J4772_06275 [Cohnella sp. LGH]